jgi:Zn-dependent metalloprotease
LLAVKNRFGGPLALAMSSTVAIAATPMSDAAITRDSKGTIITAEWKSPGPPLAEDPSAAARAFMNQVAPELGVSRNDLRLAKVRHSYIGAQVRFEQFHQGIAVVGGYVDLLLTQDFRVSFLSNKVKVVSRSILKRQIDAGTAIAAATRGIEGVVRQDGGPSATTREILVVEDGVARLAYEVRFARGDTEERALIDATTGARLSVAKSGLYDGR